MRTIERDTIFTNVVETPKGTVWWEGMADPPHHGLDWRGRLWSPGNGEKGAHPNSRFTAPATNCPTLSPRWDDPFGVPVSAILFGGRRARVAPLVYQALNWEHGVYVGASMASETTAAAAGQVGVVRRDPMAMLPFCGYNMGDYFGHWLEMGRALKRPPRIFHVNWFRTDDRGDYLWPGFGENIRVLKWIVDRCHGQAGAAETPIGYVPGPEDLELSGLGVPVDTMRNLLSLDQQAWLDDLGDQETFFAKFGERLPEAITRQRTALVSRLSRHFGQLSPLDSQPAGDIMNVKRHLS
jgi:phosphoenolpyruvate carboxykinase (GTP)